MKILRNAFLIWCMLTSTTLVFSQENDLATAKQQMYQAYLTSSKLLWNEAIASIEQHSFSSRGEKLTYLTEAQFGLLIYTLAKQDEATFDQVSDAMEDNLEQRLKIDKKDAHAHALLAHLYGTDIAFNNYKGAYLGMASSSHVEKSLKYAHENPLVWYQNGNYKYFTPAMFGGSLEEAIQSFEKAVTLYEEGDTAQNWQYLNALAWLGNAYKKDGQHNKAIATYEKALAVEPDFDWVKYVLLPETKASAKADR